MNCLAYAFTAQSAYPKEQSDSHGRIDCNMRVYQPCQLRPNPASKKPETVQDNPCRCRLTLVNSVVNPLCKLRANPRHSAQVLDAGTPDFLNTPKIPEQIPPFFLSDTFNILEH